MKDRDISLHWEHRYTLDALIILALFTLGFFLYRNVRISGLYMDDLYMWSCYGEQSFREFVFPVGSTRCRFVYWICSWFELALIRNNMDWIVPINIIIAGTIATCMYGFSAKLSGSKIVGSVVGVLYLSSRFSYYQVGQLLGLMESMALFMCLLICYLLYRYTYEEVKDRYFYIALVFYFLICFTHERYMVLLPMFWFALIVKKDRQVIKYAAPLIVFAVIQFIRALMIGTIMPAGTGGTNVAETISASGIIKNCIFQLMYMFGINMGPEHLSAIRWSDTSVLIRVVVIAEILILFFTITAALITVLGRRRRHMKKNNSISVIIYFVGFIIGCIVSSAVTIRVEMRWVYISYALALLLLSYMYGMMHTYRLELEEMQQPDERLRLYYIIPLALILIYGVLCLISDGYYGKYENRIYLFQNQKRYNSLADQTYGKYKDDIWGKTIYIIGDSYEMSEFTSETFFKTFDKTRTGSGIKVLHVDSARDIGQIRDNVLVIEEDPATDTYTDITTALRNMRCEIEYGYYRDGWMDQEAMIYVTTGENPDITLELMYPGNLATGEKLTIIQGDEKSGYMEPEVYDIKENVTTITIHSEPYKTTGLHFSYNYIMQDAREQRGDTPLSTIVTIESN